MSGGDCEVCWRHIIDCRCMGGCTRCGRVAPGNTWWDGAWWCDGDACATPREAARQKSLQQEGLG